MVCSPAFLRKGHIDHVDYGKGTPNQRTGKARFAFSFWQSDA